MYKGYKLLYVNGSSHSAGGGLEQETIRPGWFAQRAYKTKFGISYGNYKELTYCSLLAKMLGINFVNQAEQGGSLGRVVRMTYDFIEKNWEDRHKIILILEKPSMGRIDWFYKPDNQYHIMNTESTDGNGYKYLYTTREYFPHDKEADNKQDIFRYAFVNFVDCCEIRKQENRMYAGIYHFCKKNEIALKLLREPEVPLNGGVSPLDIISYNGDHLDFIYWATSKGLLIVDETDGVDYHPGITAHRKYAEILKTWLDQHLDYAPY